jgi:serine/threonine protein phosphatase PrpC
MEDALVCEPNFVNNKTDMHVFGVFDGHGGKEVSHFCHNHFAAELAKNKAFKKKDYDQALKETFMHMDEMLATPEYQKELKRVGRPSTKAPKVKAGCTACVVLMTNNTLYVANAGDARCLLSRGRKAVQITTDHKPEMASEKKRIEAAGGFVNEEGRVLGVLNVSRAIGDLEFKDKTKLNDKKQIISAYPDIFKREIKPSDEFLVIGCDGVYEFFSNQELIEFVGKKLEKGIQVSKICSELLDMICAIDEESELGSYDNMTCIIIVLKDMKVTTAAKKKNMLST